MSNATGKVFAVMNVPHKTSFVRGKAAFIGGRKPAVFVAMSGGVDSSVAALLLKRQGYDTVGVFMRCWSGNGSDASVGVNCAERDAEDARRVAEHIGIPFYTFDFEEEYKKRVVDYMVEGYRAGLTPNPDVMCNREIKFGLFLEKALALGADCVATGHYVRLAHRGGAYRLFAAKDKNKDQSYFLWTLTQNQLKHCLFPIGDYLKSEVRAIAKKAGLPTAEKKDSQGICFLGSVELTDFLKRYLPERRGNIYTAEGIQIGTHPGAWFYTVGQRHGFGAQRAPMAKPSRVLDKVGTKGNPDALRGRGSDRKRRRGQSGGATQPHYIVAKDTQANTLVVAEGDNHPTLFRKEMGLSGVNFICPSILSKLKAKNSKLPVMARVRYRQPLAPATLYKMSDAARYKLLFDDPQKFVAPGQSAVFYLPAEALAKGGSGLEMLGGGIIQ